MGRRAQGIRGVVVLNAQVAALWAPCKFNFLALKTVFWEQASEFRDTGLAELTV